VIFKAGKNRDGYFNSDDILKQVSNAIDIFEERHPYHQALFAFDNAPSHQARSSTALSARKMPCNPKFWEPSPSVKMRNAVFADGSPQELYFPPGHPKAGQFKGMREILIERGLWPGKDPVTGKELAAECKGFRCPDGVTNCCTRRLLFSQPDFASQKTALEELVESRGHICIFYPKYHCELNFIEMVWGAAKYEYRMFARPNNEHEMEQNIQDSLTSVSLRRMRMYAISISNCIIFLIHSMVSRFANRAARFIASYHHGLTGAQAAWANKKYHGHHTLPPDLIKEALKR
jgi:hypothetical protein